SSVPPPDSNAAAQPFFGVYDSLYGYFVRLPEEWNGKITIVDGTTKGDWQVRLREGNLPLLSVRVTAEDKPAGTYVRAAGIGTNSILLYFGNQCTDVQIRLVRTGVTVL
ncbi:MAG: hypothetical protein RSG59_03490, partial [Ruthenibacterium sp.]